MLVPVAELFRVASRTAMVFRTLWMETTGLPVFFSDFLKAA